MATQVPSTPPRIIVYHSAGFPHVAILARLEGLELRQVSVPHQVVEGRALLLLDRILLGQAEFAQWSAAAGCDALAIAEVGSGDAAFLVPEGWPELLTGKALQNALAMLTLRHSARVLSEALVHERDKTAQLTSIAQDLSAETNLDRLLTKILYEGRNLACCDAASLFLIEKDREGSSELVFKLTQNDSISFPFEEKRFPLNSSSIAGFVAITGEVCNIADVYESSAEAPYVFNRSIDAKMGYRTRSNLTLPMRIHQSGQEIIGVLQFLNRKTDRSIRLLDPETTLRETLPFTDDLVELLLALASQAAIAIENANLIAQVQGLFEGFVKASVTAIEQRDPTTSGHSFRVANLTTQLALAVPRSGIARFHGVTFDDVAIREIRYASLLHDFGKVGVREHVLVKANKLPERGLDMIRLRFGIFKERLRALNAEERLAFTLEHGREAYERMRGKFEARLSDELARFEAFYQQIALANQPTVLSEGSFEYLQEIRRLPTLRVADEEIQLLEDSEYLALSVRRGSLTPEERLEIESHVRHTYEFLSRIPWTRDLRNAPEIAFAHHEKMDGTGYPRNLKGEEIPLASRMMTVSDIYDALTASDRPYKPAVPRDRALGILEDEAKRGYLDPDLVRLFIQAEIFTKADFVDEAKICYTGFSDRFIKRGTCDYDLPNNPWDTGSG